MGKEESIIHHIYSHVSIIFPNIRRFDIENPFTMINETLITIQ